MSRITLKFNVFITFAIIAYMFVLVPILPDDETPLFIESIFPGNDAAQFLGILLSIVLSVVISLLIIRETWNRIFPYICGWKEINLAESYALSILFSIFVFGSF